MLNPTLHAPLKWDLVRATSIVDGLEDKTRHGLKCTFCSNWADKVSIHT